MLAEKIGCTIECVEMKDPHPVPPGTKGVVVGIDDLGQIHVKWENGRTLAIIPEVDKFLWCEATR